VGHYLRGQQGEDIVMSSLNPHAALIYTMVIASAIDAEMTDV
jgi:hypothetical protein